MKKKWLSTIAVMALAAAMLPVQKVDAAEMNWTNNNGTWTASDASGEQIKGWYKDQSNCWYFLDWTTGVMKTGWIASGSDWYYMNPANGIMQTGWQKINGDWYYLSTSGAKAGSMQKGTQTIDGVKQNLDSESGKLVNKGEPLRSHYQVLDDMVDEILTQIITPGMSEEQELRAIHDWVCNHLSYGGNGGISDIDLGKRTDGKKDVLAYGTSNKCLDNYKWAYKAIKAGKGVCDDYVQVFNVLADALGYKTSVMQGQYDKRGHGVSLVWFNGEWLMVDCQLDDSVQGKILDIGFLKRYQDQTHFNDGGSGFDWSYPEDDYIQNARINLENGSFAKYGYETLQDIIDVYG